MKKLVMLILLSLSLVACGEKFPYTSKSEKIKLLKEYQEAYNKLDESADEKASKEIEEWNKLVIEMNIEF